MQIGFMIVDRLAADAGVSVDKKQHNAVVGKGRLHGAPVLLAKPTTFMNSSGKAVRKLMDYYKVNVMTTTLKLCLDRMHAGLIRIFSIAGRAAKSVMHQPTHSTPLIRCSRTMCS